MTQAQFLGAALRQLRSADLELAPGRYVTLSSEPEPLQALIALASGQETPARGSVLLDGIAPAASPEARRRIAALLADEALPPDRNTERSVARVLSARGDNAGDAARVLADAGLAQLAALPTTALAARETRSVALALALAHERAELFALHEPLATSLTKSSVLEALDRHVARGAIVFCTTTSTADAVLLGGQWLCVELGRLRAEPGERPRLGFGPWQQVLVEASDAQSLALLLHASPHGLSTELGSEPSVLKVTGPALDVTVRELIGLARQHGIEIRRLSATVPPVESLLAARAGFARGAYEAARHAALGSAAPPPAGPYAGGYT
jgi:ABC-type transport system involved in cytochrome c biogenesis ATPase subunit